MEGEYRLSQNLSTIKKSNWSSIFSQIFNIRILEYSTSPQFVKFVACSKQAAIKNIPSSSIEISLFSILGDSTIIYLNVCWKWLIAYCWIFSKFSSPFVAFRDDSRLTQTEDSFKSRLVSPANQQPNTPVGVYFPNAEKEQAKWPSSNFSAWAPTSRERWISKIIYLRYHPHPL